MEAAVTAKAALLAALLQGKGFGLELIERVHQRTQGQLRLGDGSVYPTLRAMEREGLLVSHEADPSPERGGRPRRYYELTAEGMRAAKESTKVLFVLGRLGEVS